MINRLKEIFGPKCTAININHETSEFINIPSKQLKFCEAVNYSFNVPLRLHSDNLICPGGRRSIGFNRNDRELAETISNNNNIPLRFINRMLTNMPKLHGVQHINMGLTEYLTDEIKPDLFILYVQPDVITTIMHKMAQKALHPSVPPYSMLSVCGNVLANSYINHTISISFGCPESRKYGGIKKNEVVLGIPYEMAVDLIRDDES